jgi:hypothetical protein
MKQKIIIFSSVLLLIAVGILITNFSIQLPILSEHSSGIAFSSVPLTHQSQLSFVYLVAGGDIMFSRNIGYYNKRQGYDRIFGSGNYNPISAFPSCTSKDCLLFFNLESLFHPRDNDIQMGGFTFRANTGNIEVLR